MASCKSAIAARLYLLAAGIGMVAQLLFFIHMGNQKLIPFSLWSINILTFAVYIDMILLSLALAYRIKNITEQKQQLEQLSIIKSKYRSFGEMNASIIHQWRTPLGQLGSLISNLKSKVQFTHADSKEILRVLDSSNTIIQRLSQTINTFQNFFNEPIENKPFSINYEINECLKFFKASLQDSKINIVIELDNDIFVKGNPKEFTQVLNILIENAKDALETIDDNRIITIRSYIDEKNISVVVKDNAGGFSSKNINELFSLNYSTKKDGMGLGLYIAQMIITQKFKGKIFAKNDESGACFDIQILI